MTLNPKAKQSIARTMLTDELGNSAMFPFAAVTTVDINSQKVFTDVAFSWSKRFILGSSLTVDILIDPLLVPDEKTIVILPVSFTAVGAGPVFIDVYAGVNADSDGTLCVGSNRDNRSSTTPDSIVRLNPTISSPGVKLPLEFMIPSNGTAAVATFGGQTKDDLILIARNDIKYMFRLVNQEANPAHCVFAMTLFEAIKGE